MFGVLPDCSEIDLWIQRDQPLQLIYMFNKTRPVKVFCHEGWTVIQRNSFDEYIDRFHTWDQFTYGFGTLEDVGYAKLFWIGNDYIYQLTKQARYKLRIEVSSPDLSVEYDYFQITSKDDMYRLEVGESSGVVGDILGIYSKVPLVGQPFSTKDKNAESIGELVDVYKEGWWYPVKLPRPNTTVGKVHQRVRQKPQADDCFTHLNAPAPWVCDEHGDKVLVEKTLMMIKPYVDT